MGISNRNGALWMATGVDNSGLNIGFDDAEKRIDQFEAHIKRAGDKIATITGIGFGVAGLKSFASEIINVRGEMQMLESSFEVLLGGKGVSGFMSEMKQFAIDSPISMNGVANAAQTLLGFGITAEKVMPMIKQIGDISMGNEERFKSLSLAFAQMSATGKLMGQDLLQMINAGFNPLQVISEKTGKSIGDLKKDMESGSISSQMVADAFASATAEGGKFYGMTQKQAEGIRGLQAQLEGGLQDAYNKIGQSQEGLITGGYKLAISLVENYEKVGKVLVSLITTYGAYKVAVILASQAEAGWNVVQLITYNRLLLVERAQKLLNATMLANPYVLLATVVIGLVTAMWALNDATTAQESAQKKLNDILEDVKTKKEELGHKSNELIGIINSETKSVKEQILAYKELQKEHQKYLGNKSFEDFKKLSPKEQQQLIDKSSFELSDTIINESLIKYKRLQDALNNRSGGFRGINEGVDLLKDISKELGIEGASAEYIRKTLSETITLLEKQKEVRDEAGKEAGKGPKAIQDQIFSATKSVQDLKKELEDLQKGIIPDASKNDAVFDFAKTIEEKTKLLKDAENKLNLLLYGKSTSEIDKGNKAGESAADKALKLAQKQADDQLKLNNDKARAALDTRNIELENQQSLLNLQEDGFEKQQKQAELNHQKEMLAIDKRAQELIEKKQDAERKEWDIKNPNGSKTSFTPKTNSIADLDYNDITGIIESDIIATKTREKATADSLKAALEEYQSYVDKYTSISTKFNKKIAEIEKARTPENSEQIDRSIAEVKFQQDEAIKAVNDEFAQREETFQAWTNQIADLSLKQLQTLLSQVEAELKAAEESGVSGNDLAVARAKVDAAKERIRNVNTTTTPGKRTIKEWQDLEKTLNDVSDSFEDIGDAVGGTAGEILTAAGQITSSTLSMINGIITLANSAASATEQTAKAASASIQAVEKASVILAIISAALQIATKIASLFAADYSEYEKAKGVYESYIAVLDKVIEKQKELVETMTGENARNSYEYALELIKKQEAAAREIGLIFAGSGSSAGSRSKGRRAWDRISDQGWSELAEWNKELSGMAYNAKNIDWLFGQSAEELQRLQEVAPTFWAQLGDDIGGYLQAIIDSGEASKELMEYYKESITQVSFDSFRESFLETLSDMNSSSEDFADNFEKYLQKAILNGLLKEKYDSQIRALYDSFSKYGEDGIDQAEYDILQKQKDDLVDSMLSEREKLKDLFNWGSEDTRSSEAKGFASVSQDSADYLTGLWTISVEYSRNINENVKGLYELAKGIASSFIELRNNTNSILQSVLNIEENTRELYFMREDISSMRQDINTLVLHGLILKK